MKTMTRWIAGLLAVSAFAQTQKGLTQAEAEAAVAAALPSLEAIRGIKFKTKVPVTIIDDEKARAYALGRYKRMTPEAKIRSDETTYRLLGLIPKDMDLVKTLLDVLEEQAGGFYDPGTKSFYLLDDMPKDMAPMLTAHEMTHALEDQRYDIDGRLAKVLDDDDAAFALSSVAEGSASIAADVYLAEGIKSGALDPKRIAAMGEGLKMDRLNAMPACLRRELMGPYILGMKFLARGKLERLSAGFPKKDVDAAWAHPPRSSEQILHPEKYWDPAARDEPKRVAIDNPSRILGEGWTKEGSGVLGELMLGVLVGAKTPEAADLTSGFTSWTNAAAAGWGGDRFELWRNGSSAVVLLATVWDTAKDATEFEQALPSSNPDLSFRREGEKVGIVAGAPAATRDALLSLLVRK